MALVAIRGGGMMTQAGGGMLTTMSAGSAQDLGYALGQQAGAMGYNYLRDKAWNAALKKFGDWNNSWNNNVPAQKQSLKQYLESAMGEQSVGTAIDPRPVEDRLARIDRKRGSPLFDVYDSYRNRKWRRSVPRGYIPNPVAWNMIKKKKSRRRTNYRKKY